MKNNPKKRLAVEPLKSRSAEVGRWLWAIEDTRRRTLKSLDGLAEVSVEILDWISPVNGNSIGTILYHLAAIEASWLYEEVLQAEFPAEMAALLPYDVRDDQGLLIKVQGTPLAAHLSRLEVIRSGLLPAYAEMTLEDFTRARSLPDYEVSPEWVLHHLMQHEGEHRGQIMELRMAAKRAFRVTKD